MPAAAQNDNCATPLVISGTGTFAFDTTAATTGTEGQANPFCLPGATGHDVWFQWTAPQSGNVTFMTCGQVPFDTKIAAYPNPGCPAGPTPSCDDDACGLESLVVFQAVAGNIYMLQVGGSGLATSNQGPGTFSLSIAGPPANDDCASPVALGSSGGGAYDNTQATTGSQGQTCIAITKDLWFTWVAPQTGSATLDTCFQSSDDTAVAVYLGTSCPSGSALACDDNGCGIESTMTWSIVAGTTYLLQIGSAFNGSGTNGSFVIQVSGSGSSGTPFCFGDGSGTACPCGNSGAVGHGCANSINAGGAQLDATGSVSVANDTVVLQGTGMPPNSAALYFQGTTQVSGGLGTAFGDGLRCIGGTIVRLGIRTNDGAGASVYGGPLGDTPISIKGQIPAGGGTRQYQAWYRNAAAFCTANTFNLGNAVEVTWAP